MSNHHFATPGQPVPSHQCALYADLLPVLDEPETDPRAAAQARAHLAGCAFCQAQVARYAQLETVIARAVGSSGTPRRTTEEIMRDLLRHDTSAQDQERTPVTAPVATSLNAATTAAAHRPSATTAPRRRWWSGLAALAAVLAVALLAASLFAGRGHGPGTGPGAKTIPTPDWTGRGSQTSLASISMVSPTEGWAAGSAFPANGTNGNQARPLLLHYQHGVWSSMRLDIAGQVNSISMVSATDGWAVGTHGLILHYDGTAWRQVASPTQGGFTQVQMLSATDGWAVGDAFANGGLFHYDGHAWTPRPAPASSVDGGAGVPRPISFTAISMLSPTDGWAIGSLPNNGLGKLTSITPATGSAVIEPSVLITYILRYHNGTWSVDDTLTNLPSQLNSLQSISMSSADEGWAAGGTTTLKGAQPIVQSLLLLHYTGGAWHRVPDPLAGSTYHAADFVRIAMPAADDGWITAMQNSASKPIALHYDGSRWNVVPLPDIPHSATWYLNGLTYTSAGDLWAIGARLSDATTGEPDGHGGFTPTITPLLLHEQQGVWSVVAS
ncbi:MAG TPA: hypothetical protein VIG30_02255 [Ktedonobacterales bacterium]